VCAEQSGSRTYVGKILAVSHADVWGNHFVASKLPDIPTMSVINRHTRSEGYKPIVYGFVIVEV